MRSGTKRIHGFLFACTLTLFSLGTTGVRAEPVRFLIAPGAPTVIKFTSTAPMETFSGGTDELSGWFTVDPTDLSLPLDGELVAKMASFRTGVPVRDRHMRENHLHVEQFPTSLFEPKRITSPLQALLVGSSVEFTVTGDFTLHGVTREVEAVVNATLKPDRRAIEVIANFNIPLADFNIPRPEFLFMRLGEVQKVETKFTAKVN